MGNYIYEETDGYPIKMWTKGVQVGERAKEQLRNISKMPFLKSHIACMPDVHWGKGATVGSVIATKGAVIPAAVGVDLGCGMCAVKLSLKAHQLPDNLKKIRNKIEQLVPHGRTNNGAKGDKGAWSRLPSSHERHWVALKDRYDAILNKHPKVKAYNTYQHMGTLGTGNHFIEVCLDEFDNVWIMLHTGSRGAGNKIGSYFIEQAKLEMERYHITDYLPDQDLSYLVEHTSLFDDYVNAVEWAQDYAMHNRAAILESTLQALRYYLPEFTVDEQAINCHHNYISRESHFGDNVIVTRKGAVRARKDELGIIPGSMGTGSFIVKGLGNHDSFCSCSHGAGRVMSRGEAKKAISIDDHKKAMQGIEARLDKDVLDESPAAYKDIGKVMDAQSDLVEIMYRLRQVINVKG
tara:strand:+ start:20053 stop:21273 length:1221 start_codon:yes stop_codon:yes gene_type:complete